MKLIGHQKTPKQKIVKIDNPGTVFKYDDGEIYLVTQTFSDRDGSTAGTQYELHMVCLSDDSFESRYLGEAYETTEDNVYHKAEMLLHGSPSRPRIRHPTVADTDTPWAG